MRRNGWFTAAVIAAGLWSSVASAGVWFEVLHAPCASGNPENGIANPTNLTASGAYAGSFDCFNRDFNGDGARTTLSIKAFQVWEYGTMFLYYDITDPWNSPVAKVLANYTGSFDNVATGKQVGQDLVAKGADVVFQAAGADGLGVIQAVKEAKAAGKNVYVIGVDSDQYHVAPEVVLTSMLKRVDLAIYDTDKDVVAGNFKSGDSTMGLKEGGVGMAEIRMDIPGKAEALQKVEALRQKVVAGELKVPTNMEDLKTFKP